MNWITQKEDILSQHRLLWTKLVDWEKIHAIYKSSKGLIPTTRDSGKPARKKKEFVEKSAKNMNRQLTEENLKGSEMYKEMFKLIVT